MIASGEYYDVKTCCDKPCATANDIFPELTNLSGAQGTFAQML